LTVNQAGNQKRTGLLKSYGTGSQNCACFLWLTGRDWFEQHLAHPCSVLRNIFAAGIDRQEDILTSCVVDTFAESQK